jgi:hypothetical protein
MISNDQNTEESEWIEIENPGDWISTAHEKVYFRDESPRRTMVSTPSLIKAGAIVAKALPGEWTVIITAGPYRGYDVRYNADCESQRVYLDFYSPRPGYQYLGEVIDDVKQVWDDLSDDQTEASA